MELQVDDSFISGEITAELVAKVLGDSEKPRFASLLTLVPEGKCPDSEVKARGIEVARIITELPGDGSRAQGLKVHQALEALPKPTWIACATGNRASGALLIHEGIKRGWTAAQALAYAAEHGLKPADPVRSWVTATLDPISPKVLATPTRSGAVVFRQLFDGASSTYTYILACPETGDAVIVDPVLEHAKRDATLINELGLHLRYALNTHVHADHITGTTALRKLLASSGGAPVQSVLAAASKGKADVLVAEGDSIKFGTRSLRVIKTSGHTNGCISFVLDDSSMAFTGDALFVRGCGRTDFQEGSAADLYDNIVSKVFTLPEECLLYPGHDYTGRTVTTVAEEKRFNPRLSKGRDAFIKIMAELGLAPPKMLDIALPANLIDGEGAVPAAAAAPAVVAAAACTVAAPAAGVGAARAS